MTNSQSKLLKALAKGPGHPIETVADALDHIAALTKASAELLEAFEKRERELKARAKTAEAATRKANERIAELEGEVKALNETIELHECAEEVVAEAVSVLQKLKAGRTAEATLDLDLIVSRNDPGAKARTSTVAVLL